MTHPAPKGIQRIKTRHVGVYYRESSVRFDKNGRPDKCFDISWSSEGKMKWEKVGWKTEGYTIDDAIELRGIRIKADRHPELVPSIVPVPKDCTLREAWKLYQAQWLPRLSGAKAVENQYYCYIDKKFGDLKISQITTFEIQQFSEELINKGAQRPKKVGLESSTVNTIMGVLRRILRKANEWGLHQGELPVFHRLPTDDRREKFLTPNEANEFLINLVFIDCQLYYIAKISLFTGMRLDEILSLQRDDIDITSRLIYITKRTKQKGKRVTGKRFAVIPEDIVTDMKFLISKNNTYLFTNIQGKKWTVSRISSKFSIIIQDMGFNRPAIERKHKFVFHSLRHTFCSWLAIDGVAIFTIKELAGHSSIEMTQRYSKLTPDAKQEAIKHIGMRLAAAKTKSTENIE